MTDRKNLLIGFATILIIAGVVLAYYDVGNEAEQPQQELSNASIERLNEDEFNLEIDDLPAGNFAPGRQETTRMEEQERQRNEKQQLEEQRTEEQSVQEQSEPVESFSRSTKSNLELLKPVQAEIMRQPGWYYHPVFADWRFQNGVYYATEYDQLVMAAASGVVKNVSEQPYLGLVVELKHADGMKTVYGHLAKINVSAGEEVAKGQEIGRTGQTGITDRPVLYFNLSSNEQELDPIKYLSKQEN